MVPAPPRYDALSALGLVAEALEEAWLPSVPDDVETYPYVPLPMPEFLRGMAALGPPYERSFLDVGCGIGTKLALARALGWGPVAGLDHRAEYVAAAERLVPYADLTLGRAETFDRYGEFDAVYIYRLFVDLDAERDLVRSIADQMRPGALLFHAGGPDPDWLAEVGDGVWRI